MNYIIISWSIHLRNYYKLLKKGPMTFNLILKLHTGGVYHYRYVQLLSFIKITINYSSNTIFYDICLKY